jgi:DHA1 family bicyclomycin/chloramphenicol resistance-like MFS transporter
MLLVLVALMLPETLRAPIAGAAGLARLAGDYLMLLRTPQFLVIAATGCLIQGAMFSWISGSSFAVITVLGRSPSVYSLVYAVTVFGFVMGSFASSRVIARVGQRRLIALGGTLALAGSGVAVALNVATAPSLLALVAPLFVVAVGHGFTLAQAMAGTMAAFPHLAGTASALFGCMQYCMATIVVVANGLLFDGTALPMLIVSVSCAVLAILCFALFGKHVRLAGG